MIDFSILNTVEEQAMPNALYEAMAQMQSHALRGRVDDVVNMISAEHDVHFVTNGEFSLHELAEAIVNRYGSAQRIILSTFSFTELPARTLARLKDEGKVGQVFALVDVRARANYPGVFQQLDIICDALASVPVHAKVTIFEYDNYCITLTGSANWTTNRRYEIGHITLRSQDANFHKNWILNAIYDKQHGH